MKMVKNNQRFPVYLRTCRRCKKDFYTKIRKYNPVCQNCNLNARKPNWIVGDVKIKKSR